MATKLKKMKLTSVDLVRSGANQEADICLYKSADPPEATESPTEPEKNIFKRFIHWLRENPTEAATEPHSHIEKGDETPDLEFLYKSALAESLHSIMNDDTLNEIEKKDMSETSLRQYADKIRELERRDEMEDRIEDRMEGDFDDDDEEIIFDEIDEVDKFNQNHDPKDGKFSSGGGSGGWTVARGGKVGRNAMMDKPKKPEIKYVQTGSEKKPESLKNPNDGKKFITNDNKWNRIKSTGKSIDQIDEIEEIDTKKA